MKQTALATRGEGVGATLLWCIMGLLAPRAALFGALSPFGIGLAACGGAANLPTLLCVGVGYLLATPILSPVRYIAAVALIGGGRWVLDALPERGQQPFVPPLLSFFACAATGLITAIPVGADGYRILLILTESVVAAGSALFFDMAMTASHRPDLPLSTGGQTAMIAVAAVAVSAAATVEIAGFSPGRVAAAIVVLICARAGKEAGGCVVGCVLGGGLALTSPDGMLLAAAYTFGGLLAGVFARFGRVAQALVFVFGALLIAVPETASGLLIFLYELFAAGVVFCLLPLPWEQRISRLLLRRPDLAAAEGVRRMTALRLQVACGAMEEVAQSVETVSRRLTRHGAADLASLYRGCAGAACAPCAMRGVCWDLKREDTLAALETLTPLLQQEGKVTAAQLQDLPVSCRRGEAMAAYLTQGYANHLAREEAWSRLEEIRGGVEQQFGGTVSFLKGLTHRLQDPHGVEMALSAQVTGICEDYGMAVEEALCVRNGRGRLTVHILARNEGLPEGRWHARLEQACGCALAPPTATAWGDKLRVTLSEPPRYRVEQGIAQHTCAGEALCGDTVQVCDLEDGLLAVISDGMGCGPRAAVDSAMATDITTRLWRADFAADAILQTVNAALLVKSREESLSTLDVAAVDTHTGRLELYKAGGAATLLRSGTRVSRLEQTGLPLGILPKVRFEHSKDTLSEGDVLLMVSDGALSGGMAAVEELLQNHPAEGSMQALAQAVVDAAVAAAGDHPDDVTAVALRLCPAAETAQRR